MIFLFLVRFHPDMLSDSNSIGKPFRWASESEHYVSKGFHNVLSLLSIASNELESDSISGWNLTQAYNNRLDLGAYRTYYKGFTCFFNNTVLRGAGLNGCAIFVRKYWDRTVWRWCIFYFLGAPHFHLTNNWLEQPVFSAHHQTGASRLYVFCLPGRGWGVWEERGGATRQKRRDSNSFEAM